MHRILLIYSVLLLCMMSSTVSVVKVAPEDLTTSAAIDDIVIKFATCAPGDVCGNQSMTICVDSEHHNEIENVSDS